MAEARLRRRGRRNERHEPVATFGLGRSRSEKKEIEREEKGREAEKRYRE